MSAVASVVAAAACYALPEQLPSVAGLPHFVAAGFKQSDVAAASVAAAASSSQASHDQGDIPHPAMQNASRPPPPLQSDGLRRGYVKQQWIAQAQLLTDATTTTGTVPRSWSINNKTNARHVPLTTTTSLDARTLSPAVQPLRLPILLAATPVPPFQDFPLWVSRLFLILTQRLAHVTATDKASASHGSLVSSAAAGTHSNRHSFASTANNHHSLSSHSASTGSLHQASTADMNSSHDECLDVLDYMRWCLHLAAATLGTTAAASTNSSNSSSWSSSLPLHFGMQVDFSSHLGGAVAQNHTNQLETDHRRPDRGTTPPPAWCSSPELATRVALAIADEIDRLFARFPDLCLPQFAQQQRRFLASTFQLQLDVRWRLLDLLLDSLHVVHVAFSCCVCLVESDTIATRQIKAVAANAVVSLSHAYNRAATQLVACLVRLHVVHGKITAAPSYVERHSPVLELWQLLFGALDRYQLLCNQAHALQPDLRLPFYCKDTLRADGADSAVPLETRQFWATFNRVSHQLLARPSQFLAQVVHIDDAMAFAQPTSFWFVFEHLWKLLLPLAAIEANALPPSSCEPTGNWPLVLLLLSFTPLATETDGQTFGATPMALQPTDMPIAEQMRARLLEAAFGSSAAPSRGAVRFLVELQSRCLILSHVWPGHQYMLLAFWNYFRKTKLVDPTLQFPALLPVFLAEMAAQRATSLSTSLPLNAVLQSACARPAVTAATAGESSSSLTTASAALIPNAADTSFHLFIKLLLVQLSSCCPTLFVGLPSVPLHATAPCAEALQSADLRAADVKVLVKLASKFFVSFPQQVVVEQTDDESDTRSINVDTIQHTTASVINYASLALVLAALLPADQQDAATHRLCTLVDITSSSLASTVAVVDAIFLWIEFLQQQHRDISELASLVTRVVTRVGQEHRAVLETASKPVLAPVFATASSSHDFSSLATPLESYKSRRRLFALEEAMQKLLSTISRVVRRVPVSLHALRSYALPRGEIEDDWDETRMKVRQLSSSIVSLRSGLVASEFALLPEALASILSPDAGFKEPIKAEAIALLSSWLRQRRTPLVLPEPEPELDLHFNHEEAHDSLPPSAPPLASASAAAMEVEGADGGFALPGESASLMVDPFAPASQSLFAAGPPTFAHAHPDANRAPAASSDSQSQSQSYFDREDDARDNALFAALDAADLVFGASAPAPASVAMSRAARRRQQYAVEARRVLVLAYEQDRALVEFIHRSGVTRALQQLVQSRFRKPAQATLAPMHASRSPPRQSSGGLTSSVVLPFASSTSSGVQATSFQLFAQGIECLSELCLVLAEHGLEAWDTIWSAFGCVHSASSPSSTNHMPRSAFSGASAPPPPAATAQQQSQLAVQSRLWEGSTDERQLALRFANHTLAILPCEESAGDAVGISSAAQYGLLRLWITSAVEHHLTVQPEFTLRLTRLPAMARFLASTDIPSAAATSLEDFQAARIALLALFFRRLHEHYETRVSTPRVPTSLSAPQDAPLPGSAAWFALGEKVEEFRAVAINALLLPLSQALARCRNELETTLPESSEGYSLICQAISAVLFQHCPTLAYNNNSNPNVFATLIRSFTLPGFQGASLKLLRSRLACLRGIFTGVAQLDFVNDAFLHRTVATLIQSHLDCPDEATWQLVRAVPVVASSGGAPVCVSPLADAFFPSTRSEADAMAADTPQTTKLHQFRRWVLLCNIRLSLGISNVQPGFQFVLPSALEFVESMVVRNSLNAARALQDAQKPTSSSEMMLRHQTTALRFGALYFADAIAAVPGLLAALKSCSPVSNLALGAVKAIVCSVVKTICDRGKRLQDALAVVLKDVRAVLAQHRAHPATQENAVMVVVAAEEAAQAWQAAIQLWLVCIPALATVLLLHVVGDVCSRVFLRQTVPSSLTADAGALEDAVRQLGLLLPADVRSPPLLKASVVWPSKRFALALSELGNAGQAGGARMSLTGVATNTMIVSGRPIARPASSSSSSSLLSSSGGLAARPARMPPTTASAAVSSGSSAGLDEQPDPRPLPPPLTSQLFLTSTFSMLTSLSRTSPVVHAQVLAVAESRLQAIVVHPANARQELQLDVAKLISHLRSTNPAARGLVSAANPSK
ncbi:hypothetical protein CAOG_07098 [Capsaspora owczarzaki ATCC 30864]|nr:hypothetical protein CAOG_07098 [Capsaspora owczarzaki ATCC 30864]|eukprot:XP_004343822.1 hypothetical protein CAOG_07098 [Capsaspora owczarzaki ATCC 30864]